MFKLLLPVVLALTASEFPPFEDKDPPPAAVNGPSSGRLALPVTVRFDSRLTGDPIPMTPQQGGRATGTTMAPLNALTRHGLGIARRHFRDATWNKNAKAAGKGREVVIKQVTLLVTQGPTYQAQVVVDRYENGERLGQATGSGYSAPDRTNDRMAAAFAPGLLGMAAAADANKPKAGKDAAVIETAVLRAFDQALLQLAAYWSGEQEAAKYRKGK